MIVSVFREDMAGVDITDNGVIVSRVMPRGDGRVELRNAGWAERDPSASDKALAAQIRKLWRTCNMPVSTVCSCLRSRSLMLRYFRFPALPLHELESALWLQAEETLLIARADIVIDWHVNPKPASGVPPANGNATEGVLVAAPRADVDRHLALLEMAGLTPVVLDVGAMAVGNLYLELNGGNGPAGAICMLSLSTHTADVAVLMNNGWIYPYTLFSRSAAWENSADFLSTNVADVLKYCQFKLRQAPVTKVVLTGRIPASDRFLGTLGECLGLPVEVWDPLTQLMAKTSRLKRLLTQPPCIGPLMTTSLGLALRRS